MPKATERLSPITMEDVRIIYRNFAGREGRYNKKGERSFSVVLPFDVAEDLAKQGLNVKFPPESDDRELLPHLSVKLNFEGRVPPNIVQITSRGRTTLDEDTCAILDYADIKHVDLIVNPWQWEVNGNTGIAAYLKSIYVTIEEDELELKYADIEDVASRRPDEED